MADSKNGNPMKVTSYRQCFDELNNHGSGLSTGFKDSDVQKEEKI